MLSSAHASSTCLTFCIQYRQLAMANANAHGVVEINSGSCSNTFWVENICNRLHRVYCRIDPDRTTSPIAQFEHVGIGFDWIGPGVLNCIHFRRSCSVLRWPETQSRFASQPAIQNNVWTRTPLGLRDDKSRRNLVFLMAHCLRRKYRKDRQPYELETRIFYLQNALKIIEMQWIFLIKTPTFQLHPS